MCRRMLPWCRPGGKCCRPRAGRPDTAASPRWWCATALRPVSPGADGAAAARAARPSPARFVGDTPQHHPACVDVRDFPARSWRRLRHIPAAVRVDRSGGGYGAAARIDAALVKAPDLDRSELRGRCATTPRDLLRRLMPGICLDAPKAGLEALRGASTSTTRDGAYGAAGLTPCTDRREPGHRHVVVSRCLRPDMYARRGRAA